MSRFSKSIEFYRKTFKKRLRDNKDQPLKPYIAKLVAGDSVKIADIGSGPVSTIGNTLPGVKVEVHPSDVCAEEYAHIWYAYGEEAIAPVVFQDMEHMTYKDEVFDIVHCENALDHTEDARAALSEMERICKRGGWIVLKHAPNQRERYGGHHSWDIYLDGGKTVIRNPYEQIVLPHPSEEREGFIYTVWQKT